MYVLTLHKTQNFLLWSCQNSATCISQPSTEYNFQSISFCLLRPTPFFSVTVSCWCLIQLPPFCLYWIWYLLVTVTRKRLQTASCTSPTHIPGGLCGLVLSPSLFDTSNPRMHLFLFRVHFQGDQTGNEPLSPVSRHPERVTWYCTAVWPITYYPAFCVRSTTGFVRTCSHIVMISRSSSSSTNILHYLLMKMTSVFYTGCLNICGNHSKFWTKTLGQ